ncbi:MAG: hypothetical protein ACO1SX_25140 [Actinomycetota bacterium]
MSQSVAGSLATLSGSISPAATPLRRTPLPGLDQANSMLDFFHNNVWVAVLLGAVAFVAVIVWGNLDERRMLAQRTGAGRARKPAAPRESNRADR